MTLLESDPATRHKVFLETLRAYLRPEAVITDPTALRTYECDGLTGFRVVPTAVRYVIVRLQYLGPYPRQERERESPKG